MGGINSWKNLICKAGKSEQEDMERNRLSYKQKLVGNAPT